MQPSPLLPTPPRRPRGGVLSPSFGLALGQPGAAGQAGRSLARRLALTEQEFGELDPFSL